MMFGSITDSNEGLWRQAENAGFEVVTAERCFSGKEKRVDTSLVTRMCRDTYRFGNLRRDHITLVADNGDDEPVVRQLVADGSAVMVLFWAHAGWEPREAATAFHSLDPCITDLALV